MTNMNAILRKRFLSSFLDGGYLNGPENANRWEFRIEYFEQSFRQSYVNIKVQPSLQRMQNYPYKDFFNTIAEVALTISCY